MDNWRTLGDTTLATYRAEFTRLQSPMLPEAEAIHAAARPHSALALAIMFHEKKYDTATDIIPAHFHNPLAVGKPLGGIGLDRWEQYDTYADAVTAWKERVTSPTYKDGVYAKTTTLPELIHVYAPAEDKNNEIRYHEVLLERLAAFPKAERLTDEDPEASSKLARPVPVRGLPDLDGHDAASLAAFTRVEGTTYITVTDQVVAIRDTPRYQRANPNGARIGPDIKKGERFNPAWIFAAEDGEMWYLTPSWTRVLVSDTQRVSDQTKQT